MAFRLNPPTIPMESINWDLIGEDVPSDRMLAHIKIGDLDMHLEARAIDPDETEQKTVVYDDDTERLHAIADCTFQTTVIYGREYLLFALPYGD